MTKIKYLSTGKKDIAIVDLPEGENLEFEEYPELKTGGQLTVDHEIISAYGAIILAKGEVVTCREVVVKDGYRRRSDGLWVPREITGIRLSHMAGDWQPVIFKETKHRYTPLGPVKDITEEQAAGLVKSIPDLHNVYGRHIFEDYLDHNGYLTEALGSLATLLQSIPFYTENPYGEKPDPSIYGNTRDYDRNMHEGAEYQYELKQWAEAEQHVFRNSILLVNNREAAK